MKSTELSLREDQLKHLNVFTQKGLELKTEAENLKVEKAEDLVLANQTFKRAQALRKDIESNRKDLIFPFQDFVKQVNVLAKECGQAGEQAELIISEKILAYNEKVELERQAEAEKEKARLEAQRLQEEQERMAREAEEARLRKIETDRLTKIAAEQEEARKAIANEQNANKRKQAEIEAKRIEEEGKLEAKRVELEQQKRAMEQQHKDIDVQKAEMDRQAQAKIDAEKQEAIDKANKVKGLRSDWTFEILDENLVVRELCSPDSKKINAAIKQGARELAGLKIYQEKRIQ